MKMKLLAQLSKLNLMLLSIIAISIFGFKLPNVVSDIEKDKEDQSIESDKKTESMPIYGNWKTYTKKDGLPSDKIYCVRVDEDRVWVGTNQGLALLENGKWKIYTQEDGLAHRGVLSIDVSPVTGDVWIATMSGLNHLSGGKFTTYTQFNSGLANDVIYGVICDDKDVWVATGGGAGVLDTYTGKWEIYTDQNAPMHEPWTYNVCAGGGKIFIAAWGGGVIELDKTTKQFRDYTDPDGEMEIDLFPDDGIVHDITTAVSYDNDVLWAATYFGLSRYDGNHWKGYFDHDSGLASNFINFVIADGPVAWLCTDDGLSSFNGETWVTYKNLGNDKSGSVIIDGNTEHESTLKATTSISHNFTIGMDFKDNEIWVATSKGLSRGEIIGQTNTKMSKL
jgi:ligand-binding sensor domain-containing protein